MKFIQTTSVCRETVANNIYSAYIAEYTMHTLMQTFYFVIYFHFKRGTSSAKYSLAHRTVVVHRLVGRIYHRVHLQYRDISGPETQFVNL